MSFKISKAKRSRRPLKIDVQGTSGSGKTFSSLRLAFAMRRSGIGNKIVVADSENESASLYDGITIDGEKWEYDVCPIPADKQNPAGYTECYIHLVNAGYDIIIIDSMTHAWQGALARVDEIGARSRSGDKFTTGWRQVTPEQEALFRTITDARAHVITTTRVKTEYDKVTGSNGKEQWGKIGTKTVQRDGSEYEYDVVIRMNNEAGEHTAVVDKVRGCTAMDGKSAKCPGPDFWKPLFDWWKSAEDTPSSSAKPAPPIGGNAPQQDTKELRDSIAKQVNEAESTEQVTMLLKAAAQQVANGQLTANDDTYLRACGFASLLKLADSFDRVTEISVQIDKAETAGKLTAGQADYLRTKRDERLAAFPH